MSGLNPRQREAVKHFGTPLLVLAGAGSGKTRVITQKIAHLVDERQMEARHIAAVTFTNKAAREMAERVGKLVKGKSARGLTISTFHTLGLNIIRRELKTLGYKPGFSIFDAQDAEALLKDLLRHSKQDDGVASTQQWRISHWKNALLSPEQALAQAEDELDQRTALLYADYQRSLKAYNAVDFDDLIQLPVQLFLDHPETLDKWRDRIRYLLVDEYQDTNGAQYELVRQLAGMRRAFTVVGDDDQSIYAWRGARPENLAKLKEDFPDLELIKLEQNYRSSARILKTANRLIANNPHVFEKRLWSELGPGDPIRVRECKNDQHEAQWVVSEIMNSKFIRGGRYGDYAILYRGNHQARLFEAELRNHNIPYFLSGGQSFFARAEVKDVMSYLRLLANPDDDAAFLRVVNVPRREIGATTLEKLAGHANQRGVTLLAACSDLGLEQSLSGKGLKRLRDFAEWVGEFHRRAEQDHTVDTVRGMLRDIDYEGWLRDKSSDKKVAERRMKNVLELVDWLDNLHKKDPDRTLADMVNHLALQDILDQQNEEDTSEQVRLMTLHSAKGLEFPHVFLVGMEEEIIPHRTSIDEDNIEEERRLAYVGITRAQRTLTITHCAKRKRYGEVVTCDPSRFLDELRGEEVQFEGGKAKPPEEEQKKRGKAHLAGLKAMLEG
jgi:ATP-dependent DNA helicase Rep